MSGLSQGWNETLYMGSPGPDPPQEFLKRNTLQRGCQPMMSCLLSQDFNEIYMASREPDPPQELLFKYLLQLQNPQQLIEGRTYFATNLP